MEQFKTLPALFRDRALAHPQIMAQAYRGSDGKFITRTYQQLYNDVLDFAVALKDLGITRTDHVGLIADNRREWLISDLAILTLGAVDVPRGCDSMEQEISFILSSTECRVVIVENSSQLKKVLNSRKNLPLLEKLILMQEPSDLDTDLAKKGTVELLSFATVLKDGELSRKGDTKLTNTEIDTGSRDDVATIIFTSGTTGEPKGVMLTHGNYLWQLDRTPYLLDGEPGDVWLSVLPVWHSFERLMQYVALERTSGLVYSKPIGAVMLPDIAEMRPHIIPGVPRLWESLATGIMRAVRKDGGIKKVMFMFFLSVGMKYCWARDMVFGRVARFKPRIRFIDTLIGLIPWLLLIIPRFLGDVLVYRKVRAKMGGRLRLCISGGGALQPHIDEFYRAIGVKIVEGYGITETAPVLSFRDQYKPRPGCVGTVFTDTECRIVDGDELEAAIESAVDGVWHIPPALPPGTAGVILVRGGQVMKGYYKRPDLTLRALDADRWFNTGDIGMLSYDNEIKITGRAKDTIVLLGGENIEPAPIEQSLKSFEYIESIAVLGQDKKYLAALIVPAKAAIMAFAAESDLLTEDYATLLEHPQIQQLFRTGIDARINRHNGFRPFEFIFRFLLLPEPFQVGKELSGKQEMMRHRIADIYRKEIAEMFLEKDR
ncbi:MAG TPA: long-chain fatty acid--CoA ligase [Treponema sp.]|nr:long-chain fatty acid--CoA ligase [Treponema sp.]